MAVFVVVTFDIVVADVVGPKYLTLILGLNQVINVVVVVAVLVVFVNIVR